MRHPMVRFGSHWPTEPVEGDGHKSVTNERCDPCLKWERYSHLGKVCPEVNMSNIVKESLNVAGKDRINFLFLPSGLDIHDQAGTCISNRRALSPTELVVWEEAFGIGEVLEPLGYQLLEQFPKALLQHDRPIQPRHCRVLFVGFLEHNNACLAPEGRVVPLVEAGIEE